MNTVYFNNLVMGNLFHTQEDPAVPAGYYIGLSSTAPSEDGTGVTEPARNGTGYARVLLSSLSAPANGIIKNEAPITFEESITAWGVMTHYVVFDSASGGNPLFYGALSLSRSVEPNTAIIIKTGEMVLELQNIT